MLLPFYEQPTLTYYLVSTVRHFKLFQLFVIILILLIKAAIFFVNVDVKHE